MANRISTPPPPPDIVLPLHGWTQMDTIRLLRRLDDTTDGIAGVLSIVDQRLGGVERSLVVCTVLRVSALPYPAVTHTHPVAAGNRSQ